MSHLIRVSGPTRLEPDREGDIDTLEAATGIRRTAPKECSKAIGAELAPKRINRQTAQDNIRKRLSVSEPNFARPAGRAAEIGHRTFHIEGSSVDCSGTQSSRQQSEYAYRANTYVRRSVLCPIFLLIEARRWILSMSPSSTFGQIGL